MPKSKARKQASRKKKTGRVAPLPAPKPAVLVAGKLDEGVAKVAGVLAPDEKAEPQPYPYLGKELLRIAVVGGTILVVLTILAVLLD